MATVVGIVILGLGTMAMADDRGARTIKGAIPAPTHDYPSPSAEKVVLGRNLMFDKILSGNKNISCGTCHHPLTDTGDGLSLPVGEGGRGLGVTRDTGSGADMIVERVPRNAPPVFALGDRSFHTLFHDAVIIHDFTNHARRIQSAEQSGKCAGMPGHVPGHVRD